MPAHRLIRIIGLFGSLGLAACAHTTTAVPGNETSPAVPSALKEARQEVEQLRADLAAARILIAKKDAEILDFQRLVAELRRMELDLRSAVDHHQAELITLRAKQVPPPATVTLPHEEQGRADSQLEVWSEIKELRTTVELLSNHVGHLQQQAVAAASNPDAKKRTSVQVVASPRSGVSPHVSVSSPAVEPGPSPLESPRPISLDVTFEPRTIVVQPGDSLWQLARRYGCSVNELKSINHLQHNMVVIGQRLRLPERTSLPGAAPY